MDRICGFQNHTMATDPANQYPLTDEQHESKKQHFIDSISQAAVCALASRHNGRKPCRVSHKANGRFNVCFFIDFIYDDMRWVVRVPIEPAIHNVWAKVQSEVATMRYGHDENPPPQPPFCSLC